MPLAALEHRCLEHLKEHAILLECFEQASFIYALEHQHLPQALGLGSPAAIKRLEPFISSPDFSEALDALRFSHFPLVVKFEILGIIAQDRLRTLKTALAQCSAAERDYITTAYDSLLKYCEYIFENASKLEIGIYLNDHRACAEYLEDHLLTTPSTQALRLRYKHLAKSQPQNAHLPLIAQLLNSKISATGSAASAAESGKKTTSAVTGSAASAGSAGESGNKTTSASDSASDAASAVARFLRAKSFVFFPQGAAFSSALQANYILNPPSLHELFSWDESYEKARRAFWMLFSAPNRRALYLTSEHLAEEFRPILDFWNAQREIANELYMAHKFGLK